MLIQKDFVSLSQEMVNLNLDPDDFVEKVKNYWKFNFSDPPNYSVDFSKSLGIISKTRYTLNFSIGIINKAIDRYEKGEWDAFKLSRWAFIIGVIRRHFGFKIFLKHSEEWVDRFIDIIDEMGILCLASNTKEFNKSLVRINEDLTHL